MIVDSRTLQSTPESGARAGYDGANGMPGDLPPWTVQRVRALRRVLPAQGQIWGHERPLLVAHIARVLRLILLLHLSMLKRKTKNTPTVYSTGIKANSRL
jgi:hypothetical protein